MGLITQINYTPFGKVIKGMDVVDIISTLKPIKKGGQLIMLK